MRTSLGISLGAANLVAVADGRPTIRPAQITVGGSTLAGFVDRVGDPVPLVAADGSVHDGGRLVAAAIEALTRGVHPARRPDVAAVAVPAHWPPAAVAALRAVAPHLTVVSDAVAALTALQSKPGLPTRGVVALCDIGATGTSITLADAGDGFRVVGSMIRYDDFSGDLVDQAVLRHVLAGREVDPNATSAVASLAALRAEARAAKERLSAQTATAVAGIRVTRPELEGLLAAPVTGLVDAVFEVMHSNGVGQLAAVATVGGGARIPLVTQRLSEAFRLPVITGPYAQVAAAAGAELVAVREVSREAVTTVVGTFDSVETMAAPVLAWSEETVDFDAATEFVQPVQDAAMARPGFAFEPMVAAVDATPWYRRPAGLLVGAACVAAFAATGVILTSQIGGADAVRADPSVISAPVATRPMEQQVEAPQAPAVAPPAPAAVTRTVEAAPSPRVVQQSRAGDRVAKQAAPAPAPAAPAPAPAAPVPAPAPAPAPAPLPVFGLPRIPLPEVTFAPRPPASTPPSTPAPSPAPAPEPEPTAAPDPEPEPEPTVAPQPEPEPTAAPQPEPEPTAVPQPEPEPSAEPQPEPSAEPQPECVSDADVIC